MGDNRKKKNNYAKFDNVENIFFKVYIVKATQ